MVRTIVEANGLGGEKQSRNRPRDKIFIYPHKGLSSSLYEASAAKGQTKKAVFYFCRSLSSILRNSKEYHKARFTSFYVYTPSI